jgi:hypothetical protein
MKRLLTFVLLVASAFAQTATVGSHNTITVPYNGQAVPVHLAWGAPTPPSGWTVYDYCIGGSNTSGQEHGVYKGCGSHVTGTSIDIYPPVGQWFWVVWAELRSTDGTKIALTADSNEASCDFEVLSTTSTAITFYCKGGQPTPPSAPTGLTAVPQEGHL